MERAIDSFNRADNPDLGTAWDKIPNEPTAFRITSQAAVSPYATADAGESNNTVSWHADQWSEVTCPPPVARGVGRIMELKGSRNRFQVWFRRA